MQAIVLAGGQGTRLRPRLQGCPKTLAPIGGRPFLEHLLTYWIAQGVSEFVLSLGYLAEAVIGHFGANYAGAPLIHSVEERPLGTGGGLLVAASRLRGDRPFVVLNGDTLFAISLSAMREAHDSRPAAVTQALVRKGDALIGGGVYLFDRAGALSHGGRRPGDAFSLESDLLPALASEGDVSGVEFAGSFVDIGTPADYDRVREGKWCDA